ncbi:MAG TPA: D-glycerate dehydrogenase, partial [Pseudogracilibacillus sp.]|nr:D-glycerate dehydrogenase [Pseudogracilibacillus sp.]
MSKPKIYVTRKLPAHILTPFQEKMEISMWESETRPVPRDVLLDEAKKVDGILCLITEQIDEAFIEANHHLEIIANMAVGYDNIDVEVARKHQIIVTNTPDVLTETTADLTFALLMATARRLLEASSYIYEDKWKDWSPFLLAGADIHHQTIGIVGMGRIGQAVARRAKGFNMPVIYHNRSRNEEAEEEIGATYVEFDELLEEADFVVSLLPYSEASKHKFNEAAFAKMK